MSIIQVIATVRGGAAPDGILYPNEQRNLRIETYDDSPRLTVQIGEQIRNNVGVMGTAIRAVTTREYKDLFDLMQTWTRLILANELGLE
jgi:hypothetical protein